MQHTHFQGTRKCWPASVSWRHYYILALESATSLKIRTKMCYWKDLINFVTKYSILGILGLTHTYWGLESNILRLWPLSAPVAFKRPAYFWWLSVEEVGNYFEQKLGRNFILCVQNISINVSGCDIKLANLAIPLCTSFDPQTQTWQILCKFTLPTEYQTS